MISHEHSALILESRYRKPGLTLSELAEAPEIPKGAIRAAFNFLQPSQEKLIEQAAALQAQNKELKAYAHMVAHDLKDPLAALVLTANLITDVPDLTRQGNGQPQCGF